MADPGIGSLPAQLGKIHSQLDRLVRGLSRVETAVTDLKHGMDIVNDTFAVSGSPSSPTLLSPPPPVNSLSKSPVSGTQLTELPMRFSALPVAAVGATEASMESAEDSPMRRKASKTSPKRGRPAEAGDSQETARGGSKSSEMDLATQELNPERLGSGRLLRQPAAGGVRQAIDPKWQVFGSGQEEPSSQLLSPPSARMEPSDSNGKEDRGMRTTYSRMAKSPDRRPGSDPGRPSPTNTAREDEWGGRARDVRGDRSLGRYSDILRPREWVMEVSLVRDSWGQIPKQVESIGSERQQEKCVLKPTSGPRIVIDVISCVLLLYDSIVVPFMLAWDMSLEGFVLIFGWVAVSFWTMDIFFSSVTGYIQDGKVVMSPKAVFCRYLRTGFLPDLIVLGSEAVGMVMATFAEGDSNPSQMVALRLARVAKISRAVRVVAKLRQGLLSRMDQLLVFGLVKIGLAQYVQVVQFFLLAMKLGFFILWLNHLGACLWYALARSFHSDGDSWIALHLNHEDDSHRHSYLQGLYWSVASMFSGSCPVPPLGTWEVILAAIYIICSALFVTSITSFLAAMLIESQIQKQEQTKVIRDLSKFLEQRKIHPLLAMRIREQFLERLSLQRSPSEVDIPSLSMLSVELRSDLRLCLYRAHIFNNPFIRVCDALSRTYGSFVRNACTAATAELISAHAEMFGARTVMEQAYVIIQGKMQYDWTLAPSHTALATRTLPANVGQWICELALLTHWRTRGRLQAEEVCELLVVSLEALVKLLQQFPEVLTFSRLFNFELCTIVNGRSVNEELQDLSGGIDTDEVLAGLQQDLRHEISRAVMDKGVKKKQQKYTHEIQHGVESGRCTLSWTKEAEPYEIIQEASLRVCLGELVCVKLAETGHKGWRTMFHYPRRILSNQSWEEAHEELLHHDFGELEEFLQVVDKEVRQEDQGATSHTFGRKLFQHIQKVEVVGMLDAVLASLSHELVDSQGYPEPEVSKMKSIRSALASRSGATTQGNLDDPIPESRTVAFNDETSTVAFPLPTATANVTLPSMPTAHVTSIGGGLPFSLRTSRGSGSDNGTRGTSSTASSYRLGSKTKMELSGLRDWKPRNAFVLKSEDEQAMQILSVYGWLTQSEYDRIIVRADLAEVAIAAWISTKDIILRGTGQVANAEQGPVCEIHRFDSGTELFVVDSVGSLSPPESERDNEEREGGTTKCAL